MIFLIVEDQDPKVEKIRKAIIDTSAKSVPEIYVTQNVFSTIDLLSSGIHIDLLILDLNLPVREGEEIKNSSGLTIIKELTNRSEIIRPRAILGLTAANPVEDRAAKFFQSEGWALIHYSPASAEWEDSVVNKINYLSVGPNPIVIPKRKILYLGSSPKDQDAVGVGTELRRIEDVIRMGTYRDDFEIIGKQGSTFEQMGRELMVNEPEFVHFSGHGDEGGLAMEDSKGMTCYVSVDAFSDLISTNKCVRCVVLNSCYSSDQAKMLSNLGVYVLGYSENLNSRLAEEFSVGFYQALVERKDVNHAFSNGVAFMKILQDDPSTSKMELWYKGDKL